MLDVNRFLSYYGTAAVVAIGLAACAPGLRSIAPVGLTPLLRDSLSGWLEAYRPTGRVRYDLKWRFINQKGSTAGRAAVRVAPPDSLRFDYRGPFGRSGAAMMVADSVHWAVPEKDSRDLLPAAPLFWAALGIPQPPPRNALVSGRSPAAGRAWRYVVGVDTMDFVEVGPGPEQLLTEVRREGRIVARADVFLRPGTRSPLEARVRFPQDGSALLLTIEGVTHVAAFEADTWQRP